ncbi:penicillin-binding protein [Bacillus nitratireducens]|uniref:penicillin-binding protein n=1 Tax=Bacillus nitratireducens TaxID=2026193 RepID=UPI000BECFDA1|nr:penicillin-binding protein [Bacillus nitratireducens]PEE16232.1 penicillin-binding protein [Bacillus cereus]MED0903794.1 penicillin-binding protein [Bacillus nitratireducens]PFH91307.1 penicillin-binding protein [Bacillus cereus]PFM50155.1 penicillin-binding protein [Bacillus cereus]PFS11186.1 penicillin-binding protein [Bacillus cereus]
MAEHTNCVCEQLERLQLGTEVDVFLTGTTLEDLIFTNFNPDNFCVTFVDNTTEPGSIIVLDCRDIQALRIEAE